MTRQQFLDYIFDEFSVKPDFPFENDFESAIFRHKDNKKWFALVMEIDKSKLDGKTTQKIDVVNLKCDPILREPLLQNRGIYPAYHMNKVHWISVVLKEITLQEIQPLVEISFNLTKKK